MQEDENNIIDNKATDNNIQKYIFNFYAIFIMAFIPLFITPWRTDIFNDYRIIAVVVVSAIVFIITFYYRKQYEIKLLDKLLFIYAAILILSTIFSKEMNLSLFGLPRCREGIFSLLTYLIIFTIFYKNFHFSKKSLNIILISASIIAIYGILQYFKINPILNVANNEFRGSVTSTIGQRNFVGTYCTLFIPIFLGLFIHNGKKRYFIVNMLMIGLMFSSTTRSSWIAFVFYSLIFIIYCLINIKNNKKFIARFSLLLITLVLIFSFMNFKNKDMLTNRAKTVYTDARNIDNDDSGSSRIFIWKKAIPFLFKNPILGSGPDTYNLVLNDAESKKRALYFKAHNEYLQIAITEGYLALAVYISFVLVILFRLFKSRKKGIHIWILFGCITGYLIQAFFNISFIATAVIYWAILGIAANYSEGKACENK
ncbi:MAG: O-antigen ligase family protein [Clostridium sp.]|uniref:O-antigen ligase family protein n=1 Tax=Clostridium sp. TaxID=1506 RepID=UPI0039EC1137